MMETKLSSEEVGGGASHGMRNDDERAGKAWEYGEAVEERQRWSSAVMEIKLFTVKTPKVPISQDQPTFPEPFGG